jgi:hypothetical protein
MNLLNTHKINGFSDFVHRPNSKELDFLPSGPPLSALRSTFHREDLYDVTDVHLFVLCFRVESLFSIVLLLISCFGVYGLVSLAGFV